MCPYWGFWPLHILLDSKRRYVFKCWWRSMNDHFWELKVCRSLGPKKLREGGTRRNTLLIFWDRIVDTPLGQTMKRTVKQILFCLDIVTDCYLLYYLYFYKKVYFGIHKYFAFFLNSSKSALFLKSVDYYIFFEKFVFSWTWSQISMLYMNIGNSRMYNIFEILIVHGFWYRRAD